MSVMTSMPCKYNNIHACDDSFGCHLHLQLALRFGFEIRIQVKIL